MIVPTVKATRRQPAPPTSTPPPALAPVEVPPVVVKSDGLSARDQVLRTAAAACRMLGIQLEELGGKSRHDRVVLAREIITVVARRRTTRSFPLIARDLGIASHTTLVTAHTRHGKRCDEHVTVIDLTRTRGEWAAELEQKVYPPPRSTEDGGRQ